MQVVENTASKVNVLGELGSPFVVGSEDSVGFGLLTEIELDSEMTSTMSLQFRSDSFRLMGRHRTTTRTFSEDAGEDGTVRSVEEEDFALGVLLVVDSSMII